MSPSISSLSSFAPEDYSFPLRQHFAAQQTEPSPTRRSPSQLQTSPPPQQQRKQQPQQQHDCQPSKNQSQSQDYDQSRQKQRTPPLRDPIHPPRTTQAHISIPITNLHTPPPTSPRRKPGGLLLSRSSSSPSAVGAVGGTSTSMSTGAGAARTTAITSPTHTRSSSRSSSRADSALSQRSGASLRLLTGRGTGMGVGLGAGLPMSPLPSALLHRGGGLGKQRAVSSRSGSGFSPLRAGPAVTDAAPAGGRQETEKGEGASPSRSFDSELSQGWSDLGKEVDESGRGGEEHGEEEEEEEEDKDGAGSSQRHSWDSVATLRGEGPRVRFYLHDKDDDADDEGDGSNTHVGDGSDGYKDYHEHANFQGRKGFQEISNHRDYAASPEHSQPKDYGSPRGFSEPQSKDEDRNGNERLRGEQPQHEDGGQVKRDNVGSRKGDDDHEGGIDDPKEQAQRGWNEFWDEGQSMVDRTQETEEDTLPPGRVMLMERLCDLVQKLSSVRVGGGMEDDVLDVLNAKVDEMEELLVLAEETAEAEATAEVEGQVKGEKQTESEPPEEAEAEVEIEAEAEAEAKAEAKLEKEETPNAESFRQEDEGKTKQEGESQEERAESQSGDDDKSASGTSSAMLPVPMLRIGDQDLRDLSSPLPWLATTFKYSELSISPIYSPPELAAATNEALEAAKQAAQAQAEMAERVAVEAEKVNRELVQVVKRLHARKEESDHLHALLIDRAEAAASRILDLEKEVCDLEDDILANESELRHLRLKMRAVETLCHESVVVHRPVDPDLVRSIENWKADWVLVRDRLLERKKDRRERRLRLHRAGCVISSLEEREANETSATLTSLGGLSMSVSLLGLGGGGGRSPKKAY
ncbi:hypothetical protein C7999DRAFT_37014 [Corynascus novoguineensis]|uniref:Uncharacterized protein n=1 Tax=Corynascus novoguineensis TaxID=1126955 RepID=A0AAN7D1M3_9PEZI|nr:hypothetical protein C7999DRAFT_37014 [Corynascus novoguineensis]